MTEYWINIILLFFVYAFGGWCMEVILKYRQYHRFINRGFLTGPVCPIYGCGAVLITVVIGNLASVESGLVMTFALSFVICGLVEYLTSLVLEKIFHARWWDYSQKPMNLHGRVWIGNLILFGLGGVAIIHILNPGIYKVLGLIPLKTREVIMTILLVIIAADFVVSYFVLKLVKVGVDSSEADNTEEISKEVHQLLTNRSYFHKRFVDAYPEVVYRTERVQARLAAIKAETERMRQEAEKRLEAQKGKVAASLEPVHMIRADLIGKQDELIGMLYDEKTATIEMKNLKSEIDRQKNRLESHVLVKYPYGKPKKTT
ncbi:MAG: putative ABC transporter permease [Lachnospiraceae bacterium]|nr:putative ABC transporter permease [Lachnospiraceae bacterium]